MSYPNLKIIKKIKDGGQKIVFLAEHPIYKTVVYKVCKFSGTNDFERITREVGFLQSSTSIFFPKVYDFKLDKVKNEFEIIEEYIDGGSLTEKLGKCWNEKQIIELLKSLIVPVNELWSKRIVHRDIKPDNIMFRKDGTLILIDLGIARFLDETSLTQTLNILGPCTPIYAAPEQLANLKRNIDFRTDQFAIGITLLQLYLGFHPFDPCHIPGCKTNIVQNILLGIYYSPKSNVSCSDQFDSLIQRLLKTRQYQRFCSQEEMMAYIETNWR